MSAQLTLTDPEMEAAVYVILEYQGSRLALRSSPPPETQAALSCLLTKVRTGLDRPRSN